MTIASLIVDVAANTVKLQKDVDDINGKLGSVGAFASTLGKTLAGAFTVTAIVSAGQKVLDFAGKLTDLSQRTGISTTGLQKLEIAFGQSGVSIDKVVSATEKLVKNVVGGDKTAVGALEKMGLSVTSLKQMSPDQMFITVADAIGKIPSPVEKSYAAMAVFGKGGGEVLQGLTGHLAETVSEAERLGLVIGEDTIKAADDFGDQLGLLGRQLLGIVASALGPLLPALSQLGNVLSWLAANVIGPVVNVAIKGLVTGLGLLWASIATLLAKLADLAQKVPLVGKHLGGLATASDWLKQSAEKTMTSVEGLWKTTETAGTTAVVATPKLMAFGKAAGDAEKEAAKAAKAYEKWTATIDVFHMKVLTTIPTLESMGQHLIDVRGTIDSYTALLFNATEQTDVFGRVTYTQGIPSLEGIGGAAHQAALRLGEAGEQTKTFGGHVMELFTNTAKKMGEWQDSLTTKLTEMFGGKEGGVMGKIVGGGMNLIFGPATGLITSLMAQGMAKMAELALEGLKKIGGFFKDLFGGPSAKELAGREVVEAFTKHLQTMMTDQQKIEAGNEEWKQAVIVVRDAYLAMGKTEQEALDDVKAMWEAEQHGAAAAQAAVDRISEALKKMPRNIDIDVNVNYRENGKPPTSGGSDFMAGMVASSVRASAVTSTGGGRRDTGGGGMATLAAEFRAFRRDLPRALRVIAGDAALLAR